MQFVNIKSKLESLRAAGSSSKTEALSVLNGTLQSTAPVGSQEQRDELTYLKEEKAYWNGVVETAEHSADNFTALGETISSDLLNLESNINTSMASPFAAMTDKVSLEAQLEELQIIALDLQERLTLVRSTPALATNPAWQSGVDLVLADKVTHDTTYL